MKKALSLVLAMIMCLSLMPLGTLADEEIEAAPAEAAADVAEEIAPIEEEAPVPAESEPEPETAEEPAEEPVEEPAEELQEDDPVEVPVEEAAEEPAFDGEDEPIELTVIASGTCGANGDNLTWIITDEGVLTISGNGAMKDCGGPSGAPWRDYTQSINVVFIENGVTTIGAEAFVGCNNLCSVTIGSGVTSIEEDFSGCTGLMGFSVDEGNACFSSVDGVLYNKNVTELIHCPQTSGGVSIPDSVTSIGDKAFYSCAGLSSVTIPEGVQTIGKYAFVDCSGLTSVSIPSSVTDIALQIVNDDHDEIEAYGIAAFNGCTALESIDVDQDNACYCSVDGILYNRDKTELLRCPCTKSGNVAVPEGVTSIESYAFSGCSDLRSITIPASITRIRDAFRGCERLLTVYYAGTEEEWQTVSKPGGEGQPFSRVSVIYNSTGPGEDPGITVIDSGECGGNLTWTLTSDGVLTVSGSGAMYDDGIRFKGDDCRTILAAVIEEGVTNIESNAFAGCNLMESISIASSVTSIRNRVFAGCSALTEITFLGSAPSFGEEVFNGVTATAYYPAGDETWTEDVRQNYGGNITWVAAGASSGSVVASGSCGDDLTWTLTDDGVLTISGTGAMYDFTFDYDSWTGTMPWNDDRSSITEVVIEDGVTSIGAYAFYGCFESYGPGPEDEVNASVTFYPSIQSIGEQAFGGHGGLNDVYYHGTKAEWAAMSIGDYNWSLTDAYIHYLNEPPASDGGTLSTGLTWSLENGKLTISGSGPIPDYTWEDPAPWAEYSTWRGSEVYELEIGDGVTYIGQQAFVNLSITELTIPASVTGIGGYAFENCSSLQTAVLPAGLTRIPEGIFESCESLESVSIPDSVTKIGDFAFLGTSALSSVSLPQGLTAIGQSAFANSGLTEIEIPDSVTELGTYVFSNCTSITSAVIGSGVTEILAGLFEYCTSLSSVNIPAGVTSIGAGAFAQTSQLERITIPRSVREIITSAFGGSGLLAGASTYEGTENEWRQIQIYGGNETLWAAVGYTLGTSGLCGPDATWTVNGDTLTISGTGDTYDYKGAEFWGPGMGEEAISAPWSSFNSGITTVVVESGITRIGDNLFNGSCAATITLPESLTSIGEGALRNCYNMASIQLPSGLTSLGDYAFANCWQLASATIPDSVSEYGAFLYSNCDRLTSVTLPRSITSIAYGMFSGCSSLPSVDIPASVTKIEKMAFRFCMGMTSVDIPAGVTEIGDQAFYYCRGLTEASIPASVTELGDQAFSFCESLKSVAIPAVEKVGHYTFRYCNALESVTMADGVTALEYGAFMGCSSLASVTIPASVTSIEDRAFSYDSALKTVTFEGSAPAFGSDYDAQYFSAGSVFSNVTATAYYPDGDASWTADVMQNYGGSITWKAILPPLEIVSQPQDVKAKLGTTVTFTVEATGSGLTYQWYYRNPGMNSFKALSGATKPVYAFTLKETNAGREVKCRVTDKGGEEKFSEIAAVSLATPLAIIAQPQDAVEDIGRRVSFTVEAEGDELQYEWYYSNDGGETFKAVKGANEKTYSFKLSPTNAGRQVYCVVSDAYEDTIRSAVATASVRPAVVITAQPTNQTAKTTKRVEFTVEAEGSGLTYQWYYKSPTASKFAPVNGDAGIAPTYSFKLSAANAGRMLYCVVTDKDGNSVTSDIVVAIAENGPQIDVQPTDASAENGQKVSFKVTAKGGTGELTYQWYYKSATATKFSPVSGTAGQASTYTFKLSNKNAGRQLYCVITDEAGISVVTDIVTASIKTD